MPSQPVQWDFFIAHSGKDKQAAEELYDYLARDFRVFLDSRTLKYGDDWDLELPRAQRNSKITVVLVSNHTESSYYERIEISEAIGMARADAARHRVVPCFLERGAAKREDIPYGLRLKHGISLEEAGGLKQVAEKLAMVGRQPSGASADAWGVLQPLDGVVATTAAFLGQTTRGPVGRPTLLTSWAEYERAFGSHADPHVSFLTYAVKGFFDNGGQSAYVVRVVGRGSSPANARLSIADGEGLVFSAVGPGTWSNSLSVRFGPGTRLGVRIQVLCDWSGEPAKLLEDYDNVSLDPNSRDFFVVRINNESEYLRAEATARFDALALSLNVEIRLSGGNDGAPLTADDYKGGPGVDGEQRAGLAALEDFEDFSLLCVPDHVHPSMEAIEQSRMTDAVIDDCERLGNRFAILSVPHGVHASVLHGPRDTAIAATYYPWVWVSSATGEPILIPAVGHVAGAYAKSDRQCAIHISPAGREICGLVFDSQQSAGPLEFEVATDAIDRLTRLGINAITCDDNHVRMHTAFTMSIDKESKDLAAKRLLLFITKSIRLGTMWAVFERNDEQLWTELRARLSEFLTGLWKSGALSGQTAKEAFFVRCGHDTMTQDDISSGTIEIAVGLSLPSAATVTLIFIINQAY
jgi:hypothetical protein